MAYRDTLIHRIEGGLAPAEGSLSPLNWAEKKMTGYFVLALVGGGNLQGGGITLWEFNRYRIGY